MTCRVLHVVRAMNKGGVETWLMHVFRASVQRDVAHEVAVQEPGAYDEEVASLGVRLHRVPSASERVAHVRTLHELMTVERFDAVHSHMHYFSMVPLGVARLRAVPVRIAHCHALVGLGAGATHGLRERVARHALATVTTAGLANSGQSASQFFGHDWDSSPRRDVLHYGFDFGGFDRLPDRRAAKAALGLDPDVPAIGHVARFDPIKNHDFTLELAVALARTGRPFTIVYVGDGDERPRIAAQATAMRLDAHVKFLGVRSDVPQVLAAMDATILPSFSEGFGIVALEAQAAGVPSVVSSGVPDDVDAIPGMVSRLELAAGPAAWADAVLAQVSSPHQAREVCLERVRSGQFGIDYCVERLRRIYRGALPRETR